MLNYFVMVQNRDREDENYYHETWCALTIQVSLLDLSKDDKIMLVVNSGKL